MYPGSPFYLFDPDSVGSLHHKHRRLQNTQRKRCRDDFISLEDLLRIEKADPASQTDPVFQHYMKLAAKGELETPRGRKPAGIMHFLKVVVAKDMVLDRTKEIKAERLASGHRYVRGELEACIQAADEVAREMKLAMCGRALLNKFSSYNL